jgi:hypothetical protein
MSGCCGHGEAHEETLFGLLDPGDEDITFFETSVTICQLTRPNIPEDLNLK